MSSKQTNRSYRYPAALWLTALGMIALGFYLSYINFMDTEWLTRAGCAIVMLGIWSGLGVIVQERTMLTSMQKRRRNAITEAKARDHSNTADTLTLDKEIEEINEAFDKKILERTQQIRMSFGALEVSLLIFGTFIWGFGDLLVRLAVN